MPQSKGLGECQRCLQRAVQVLHVTDCPSGSVCSPRTWGEQFPPGWGKETQRRLCQCRAQGEGPQGAQDRSCIFTGSAVRITEDRV